MQLKCYAEASIRHYNTYRLGYVISIVNQIEEISSEMKSEIQLIIRAIDDLNDGLESRYQAYSECQLAGLLFDIRSKFSNLPKYMDRKDCIEKVKLFLLKY